MGRVLRSEVVAIRCDLTSCGASFPVTPQPASTDWEASIRDIEAAVVGGWAFVLNVPLRAFCVEHAELVMRCTCNRHPERAYRCTAHAEEAQRLVWARGITPLPAVTAITNLKGASV